MTKENATCACKIVHPEIVDEVRKNFPEEENLMKLSEIFKVFGDLTRIKIIYALYNSEMCVCDIAEALEMSQSAISHQLRVLRDVRIVKYRREGKSVYYSLDDDHVYQILGEGLKHVSHE